MTLGDQLQDHMNNAAAAREARESEKPLLDDIERLERENAALRGTLRQIARLSVIRATSIQTSINDLAVAALDGESHSAGTSRKWASLADFINNATEDEKREVYEVVMERANQRQRDVLRAGGDFNPARLCLNPPHCTERGECRASPECPREGGES